MAIFQHLQEITSLGVRDGGDREVVDHEDVEPREASEYAREGAIGSGEPKLIEKAGCSTVGGTVAF